MRYGHFDDAAKEYVIERPDTPRPWSNYMGSRLYGGIITNNAGGYSFYRSAADGRHVRIRYNSVPLDQPGRYFYLRDRDSGDYWSASWQPVGKPLDAYRSVCRFGTGYAAIDSDYAGIRTETTYFVPLEQPFEVWRLRVSNTGDGARRLSVFSFVEFSTEWSMRNDLLNLQYAQFIAEAKCEGGMIEVSSCGRLPEDPDNFGNRDQSRWWWMAQTGQAVSGYDLDREAFIGVYGGFHAPAAVAGGACTNSLLYGDNPCGTMQSEIDLEPGEAAELVVLLGVGRADRDGRHAVAMMSGGEALDAALAEVKRFWHARLDSSAARTPDEEFDHMVNVWNPYNALITYNWSRACSMIYTGDERDGFGFRDTVQDVVGVVDMIPDDARQRLELMLTGQESTGGAMPVVKPWLHRPGAMTPTRPESLRSDDCLWFFNAVPAYLAETGDLDFLNKPLPYADAGEASVMGHLRRALEFNLERTGANGLPCGLSADWNDCLKLGYRGESVFVTFQVRLGLAVYADLAERLGQADQRDWARRELAALDEKIQRVCWDGDRFIWAIGDDGTVYGSARSPEGALYLNTQVWAVISGAASDEQARLCLDRVRQDLATEHGVMLCAPPFRHTSVEVMRAVLFNPGCKENAGIFSHTQSWAVLAEAMRGEGDAAYAMYRAFMPSAYNDRAELRQVEPYVHCQSTHSRFSDQPGVSRIAWLSGTASWANHVATHWVLGVRPEIDGLRIDPCIPADWPAFTFDRQFRGNLVRIAVDNPRHVQRGVASMRVNGQPREGNLIQPDWLTETTLVQITMG